VEREMAQRPRSESSASSSIGGGGGGRAAARHAPGASIPLRGIFDTIDEWEAWLDPWRRARTRLDGLSESSRNVLAMRFGWDGRPPQTMRSIGRRLKRGAPVVARQLQKATRELRAAARM
jgi:hypothetical protein